MVPYYIDINQFGEITSDKHITRGGSSTDFVKGDGTLDATKYAKEATKIEGTGHLEGGGDLSTDRTLDITQTIKNNIADGKTAHGWGDHSSAGYATETYVGDAIDDIEIGTVNLLRNSTWNEGFFSWSSGFSTILPPETDKPGSSIRQLEHTHTGSNAGSTIYNSTRFYLEPKVGDSVIISFDYYCENANDNSTTGPIITFRRSTAATGGTITSLVSPSSSTLGLKDSAIDGKWVRVTYKYTFSASNAVLPAWYIFGLYMSNNQVGRTVRYKVREVMVVFGNIIPRTWTPAPEDLITDWNQDNEDAFNFLINKPGDGLIGELVTGTSTDMKVWSPKVIHDYVTDNIEDLDYDKYSNWKLGANSGGTIDITSGDKVTFSNGTNIKVSRTSRDIKMDIDGVLSYSNLPITSVEVGNWNQAVTDSHTHSNKSVLDGISSSVIEDWNEAYDKKVNAISFTGDSNRTLTVTREDGTILTASFLDDTFPEFPDDVLNTLTFNTNNDGVLRAITSEGAIIDVSLDGRYSLLGHNHVWEDITDRPTIPTSSDYITTNTTQTGLTGNKTSSGIWTLGQIRKAGQTDSSVLLAGGGHRPVSDFALAGSLGDYLPKSYNSTSAIAVSFIRSSTTAGRFKIRLPYTLSSAKMLAFTIRMYGDYTHTDIACSGYLYTNTNQWLYPSAKMIVGHGRYPNIEVDVIFGRDTDGVAYVSIPKRLRDGIAILDVVGGHTGGVYGTGWTITEDDTTPNIGATINVEGLNRLGQFTNDVGYITSSSLPTVNNGQLTLSTGTGLSGSGTFTANQSGSSSFSVAVESTHKLPTTTEWNALSTQTLTSSISNTISGTEVRRAALTGDVTASANSNATTIANNAVTHAKYQNIATQRILGRGATGNGNVQELTLGSNLSLSTGGVLNASYSAGTLTLLNEGTDETDRVWGAKPIADFVGQYAATNLGLQGVTDIGNRTTNTINLSDAIHLNGSGTMPTIKGLLKGLSFINEPGGTSGISDEMLHESGSILFMNKGTSNLTTSLMITNNQWGFYYQNGTTNPKHAITISPDLHHTERLNQSIGNTALTTLQFPPEDGTLATREWASNPNNEPPSTDPGIGLIRNGEIARYIFRNNFNINHSTRIIDAVDTTYSEGSGITLTGTTFSQVLTTSGSGTYVQSLTRTAGGIQANLGTPPNATYSQATLAQLKAGTNVTNRLINPRDFKEAVEDLTTPKQLVITATTGVNIHAGKTIILNSTSASVGIGSSTTTPDGFEVYLVNNTSTDRSVWGASGLRYKINDGAYLALNTPIKLKGNGVGTLIRIGSTDGVLALGDFTT